MVEVKEETARIAALESKVDDIMLKLTDNPPLDVEELKRYAMSLISRDTLAFRRDNFEA